MLKLVGPLCLQMTQLILFGDEFFFVLFSPSHFICQVVNEIELTLTAVFSCQFVFTSPPDGSAKIYLLTC